MGDAVERDELAVYTRILKLLPDECPPNHYVLLGISPHERDAKVIESAARQRVERLRRDVAPELLRAARVVLKKIQRAQTCLQDGRARASYDFALTGVSDGTAESSIWDELDANSIEANALSSKAPQNANLRVANAPPLRAISPKLKNTGLNKPAHRQKVIVYSVSGLALAVVAMFACITLWPQTENAEAKIEHSRNEHNTPVEASSRSKSEQATTPKPTPPKNELAALSQKPKTPKPSDTQEANSNGLVSFSGRGNHNGQNNKGSHNDRLSPASRESKSAAAADITATAVAISALSVAVALPVQRSSDSALASGEKSPDAPFELGQVPSQGLKITLDQPPVMAVEGISFDMTSDSTGGTGQAWEVRLRSTVQVDKEKEKSSLDNVAAGLNEIVARIFVEGGKLKFAWANSKYAQMAEQLRNCVLCVACDGQTHRMQLRLYQKIAPVVLDFEKSVVTFNVEGEGLPSPEAVFLTVHPSPELMKSVSMEPESGTVPVNKILTLKATTDEYQIEIRVTLKKTVSGLTVAVGPRYRIGASWQPFTTERISDGLNGLEAALVRHRDGLAEARSAVASIKSALSSAQSRLSSTDDARERNALVNQVRGLQTRLNRAQNMVARKERDIPDTEHDIVVMKKLVEVGNRLRGYTELGVRVGVKTTNGEYDLVQTE